MFEATRDYLKKIGMPQGDAFDMPSSDQRFPDGGAFRIEVPTVNSAEAVEALLVTAAKNGITINRVVDAVRGSNIEVGGRLIEFGETEYTVRGRGYAQSVQDFENIVLKASDTGTPIRVKDVGHVTVGPDIRRGVSDLDGQGEAPDDLVLT